MLWTTRISFCRDFACVHNQSFCKGPQHGESLYIASSTPAVRNTPFGERVGSIIKCLLFVKSVVSQTTDNSRWALYCVMGGHQHPYKEVVRPCNTNCLASSSWSSVIMDESSFVPIAWANTGHIDCIQS